MGEIKSAIELAMERTKNLVMDDEEKKAFARKDREDRFRALVRRFLEGMVDEDEFLRDYREIGDKKSQKGAFLVDSIREEFASSTENERLFALLEIVGRDAGGGLAEEALALKGWFRKELVAREAGMRGRIVARLKDLGISGDAVEPNIPAWEESRDAAREIASLIGARLEEWKKRLQALSS